MEVILLGYLLLKNSMYKMENRDDLFKRFAGQLASDLMNGDKGKTHSNRINLLTLALLAFFGEEAVQVIFRKNFGVGGLNALRVIACFLIFEIIGFFFFFQDAHRTSSMDSIGSPASFIWAGVFYLIIGFIVLIKGFIGIEKAKKSTQPYKFTGESAILSFLKQDGWSQSKIQNIFEPGLTLVIGIFLASVNTLWGIPIIYCALSVWACQLVDSFFTEPSSYQLSSSSKQDKDFHEVE